MKGTESKTTKKIMSISTSIVLCLIFSGCNSDISQELVGKGEPPIANTVISYSIPQDSLNNYYKGLEEINSKLSVDIQSTTRANKDKDKKEIIKADIIGALKGGYFGWKNGGPDPRFRIGLTIIGGVVVGAVYSALAALCSNYEISGMQTEAGIIDDISSFEYEYVENGLLQSMINSYGLRCPELISNEDNILDSMEFDTSCLSSTDATPYLNIIPSYEFYDSTLNTTINVSTDLVGRIHNDVLYSLMNTGTPSIDVDEALSSMNMTYLRSSDFRNFEDSVSYNFKEYGNDFLDDDGIKEVDLTGQNPPFFDNQVDLMNNTINSYIKQVESYVVNEPENCDYFINRLANEYISYISSKPFVYDHAKQLMYSAIIVGVYSCQYWKYESGIDWYE